jgi:AraC family transcriptional regulator, regulatory protein of adaptative response / DNA-3-methyladenine glycosylase II
MSLEALPSDDACYRALQSRDARFDGQFFTGVTSTGIYCRPVCRVKAPKQSNCRFFAHAAQAEAGGFRPCLRCRPELAPRAAQPAWSMEDASHTLAAQAAALLQTQAVAAEQSGSGVAQVARRLGISERHLGRIVQAHLGISPLQVLQTHRLLAAKALLTDTQLPMQDVAASAGFGSLRAFNAAFVQHYRLPPSKLRKEIERDHAAAQGEIRLQLGFRPPYDAQALFEFWQQRQLDTMELIAFSAYSMPPNGLKSLKITAQSLIRSIAVLHQGKLLRGWLHCSLDDQAHLLRVRMSDSLAPALPLLVTRLRAAFDLDADPAAIDAALGIDPTVRAELVEAQGERRVTSLRFVGNEGMRVPGSLDGFEIAVRAILGQQVTVAAGRTFTQRVLQNFGEPIQTPWPEISRCFPTPQALAQTSPESLGTLGIVKQRQAALIALSQAVASGAIDLNSPADPLRTIDLLKALPGIGDWTAHYIAMRALRWPDAFPAGDIALHNALGLREIKSPIQRARQAEEISQVWRPWRSYAVLRIWAGAYAAP